MNIVVIWSQVIMTTIRRVKVTVMLKTSLLVICWEALNTRIPEMTMEPLLAMKLVKFNPEMMSTTIVMTMTIVPLDIIMIL